ncbi:AraC family transcriptional regulator [Sphingomonas sp. S2-65]|uniref:AraC family transcriptional regulator n=1 Tax=Sphingomonas sp. S2-65 TaxID=2903960 RepID=UPI001F2B6FBE|nr:AraC family transcriptional regulator [Sphingomonas sp. S2-65]UYY58171.1 AraC family transcriptional regulator [Sphingomonas sp. S2-65]
MTKIGFSLFQHVLLWLGCGPLFPNCVISQATQRADAHLLLYCHDDSAMDLYDHGRRKYGAGVLGTALGCAWSGVAAELRHHPAGDIPAFDLAQTEIGIAIDSHPGAVVTRCGNGLRQRTAVTRGTIWTCPAGVREEEISLVEWHDCLHVYLPSARFDDLSDLLGGATVRADHIRYLADVNDSLIREIGMTLLNELRAPTAAGRVLAESLALSLTTRLVQSYSETGIDRLTRLETRHGLDDRRLRRVLDYMAAHLDAELGIEDLAAVACLSQFHFIRMFHNRVGTTPGRHLARMRLEHAKALLASGHASLYEVALSCCFSSQANFTRAFRRATGTTPQKYRRSCS